VLTALEQFLQNPSSCPHGHPIPGADGSLRTVTGVLLSETEAGSTARVLRVSEDDELLGYLGELGLKPGTDVEVVEVAPFGGPLTVSISGATVAISREVGRRVTVEVIR
jgi:DtxR family Mn-dependent transcriptional regulator